MLPPPACLDGIARPAGLDWYSYTDARGLESPSISWTQDKALWNVHGKGAACRLGGMYRVV
ncbi:hypothetical protein KNP414_01429 [Paenibacillus mucilaginosus KNP414]|uniref:Uncharacterized protein n=1 Tax=Paenibacillus mucilaginosus (strain KNP414) TaxID=1036673 RepID=F8FL74_PAEMK|nr:hypothetical protein KNP414_01429 [Paenibacillus mucilaginosus KNP414]